MAEIYAERGSTPKSHTNWILIAVIAAIVLAIIIAFAR